jgi:nucleotide-binding universal stress UspA family protein
VTRTARAIRPSVYPSILIPIDGGPCSDRAVEHGVRLAAALGSRVTLLFVMDAVPMEHEGVVNGDEALETLRAKGREIVDRAKAFAVDAGVRAEGELLEGSPAEVIVSRAGAFDLVVMGSHGKGFLKRVWLGSVTAEVLHHLQLPLLVIRDM